MPETYNPQERSFIKKPEQKVCVACGQPLTPEVKPMSNHMNSYIANIPGAKAVTINSHEQTFVVQGVTLYKIQDDGTINFPGVKVEKTPILTPTASPTPPKPTPTAP